MRLGWIDPLPQVDVIHPLGLEPNPEAIPAGEIDLDFGLPETIGQPFTAVINSVGDRIQLEETERDVLSDRLLSLSFFKAARQLYSTMQDHEKAANQPLKAVYYDETDIPLHMAGALSIIGHMETKVGAVHVRDAGVLFKRWIARGLNIEDSTSFPGDCSNLIWLDRESFKCVQRKARETIDRLVKQTYTVTTEDAEYTVSMPQLVSQDLSDYRNQINNQVPNADDLRHCVDALRATYRQYRDDDLPDGTARADIFDSLGFRLDDTHFSISAMREGFEEFISTYTTDAKWRIESIFKTGPPPAGSSGYGAQTVSSGTGNSANWKFPLSDADVNIGYLFSPARDFQLNPRLVGYSRRARSAASAAFAQSDAKAFAS
jgi:hypothetical protein